MKKELFNELTASIKEAGRIKKGQAKPSRIFKYDPVDVKNIREELSVSQAELALLIGVSIKTIQNWEQGRRKPVGPAKALLKLVATDPSFAIQALQS